MNSAKKDTACWQVLKREPKPKSDNGCNVQCLLVTKAKADSLSLMSSGQGKAGAHRTSQQAKPSIVSVGKVQLQLPTYAHSRHGDYWDNSNWYTLGVPIYTLTQPQLIERRASDWAPLA